jgi:hypothetical protein
LSFYYGSEAQQCLFIKNTGTHTFLVPLQSYAEWDAFRKSVQAGPLHQSGVSLSSGCPAASFSNICGESIGVPAGSGSYTNPPTPKGYVSAFTCNATSCVWDQGAVGQQCRVPVTVANTACSLSTVTADVAIVIDASSSMAQELATARAHLRSLLPLLARPTIRISVVAIGGTNHPREGGVIRPAMLGMNSKPIKDWGDDKGYNDNNFTGHANRNNFGHVVGQSTYAANTIAAVSAAVDSVQLDSLSPVGRAMMLAATDLQDTSRSRYMIVLSDGRSTDDDPGKVGDIVAHKLRYNAGVTLMGVRYSKPGDGGGGAFRNFHYASLIDVSTGAGSQQLFNTLQSYFNTIAQSTPCGITASISPYGSATSGGVINVAPGNYSATTTLTCGSQAWSETHGISVGNSGFTLTSNVPCP